MTYSRAHDHPVRRIGHAYPSHCLVITDLGEWRYHGTAKEAAIDTETIVAGRSLEEYECAHERGIPNRCTIIAIGRAVFDEEDRVFEKDVIKSNASIRTHVRALSVERDPARTQSLAFSLFDLVATMTAPRGDRRRDDVRMVYAKRLIEERCCEPLAVADIAREVGLSPFTFARRFRASTGSSPHAYLVTTRIDRAKAALARTSRHVEDIALENGFGSVSHFSNAFRRIVGCTPSAFRAERS